VAFIVLNFGEFYIVMHLFKKFHKLVLGGLCFNFVPFIFSYHCRPYAEL